MAMMTTASGGLTPEYETYYNTQLLLYAKPLVINGQFVQKKPFPKNKGATTIRFFRPVAPDRAQVGSLTEGIAISTYRDITYVPIDVTLAQIGEAVKISDIVSYTDLFSTLDQSVRVMGEDAGVFADFQIASLLANTTTGVVAANRLYGSRGANFAGAGVLTILDLLAAYTRLTITKARKPEGREYACVVAAANLYDLMNDAKFIDTGTKREGNTVEGNSIFDGEVGRWYGNRIMATTEPWTENAAEGTYDGTIVLASTKYVTNVYGREAVGAPIMAGQSPFSPQIIVNNDADSGNPLKQFLTAGWKAYWATVMLNNTWAVTIRAKAGIA